MMAIGPFLEVLWRASFKARAVSAAFMMVARAQLMVEARLNGMLGSDPKEGAAFKSPACQVSYFIKRTYKINKTRVIRIAFKLRL